MNKVNILVLDIQDTYTNKYKEDFRTEILGVFSNKSNDYDELTKFLIRGELKYYFPVDVIRHIAGDFIHRFHFKKTPWMDAECPNYKGIRLSLRCHTIEVGEFYSEKIEINNISSIL